MSVAGREEGNHPQHLPETLRGQRVETRRCQEREQQADRVRALDEPRSLREEANKVYHSKSVRFRRLGPLSSEEEG